MMALMVRFDEVEDRCYLIYQIALFEKSCRQFDSRRCLQLPSCLHPSVGDFVPLTMLILLIVSVKSLALCLRQDQSSRVSH